MVGQLPHQPAGRHRPGGDVAGRSGGAVHAQARETRAGVIDEDCGQIRDPDWADRPGDLPGEVWTGTCAARRSADAAAPGKRHTFPNPAVFRRGVRVCGGEWQRDRDEATAAGGRIYAAEEELSVIKYARAYDT